MFCPKVFNQKVGKVLKRNRERLSLSVEEVGTKVQHITISEIQQVEAGSISPRGYQLYELIKLYKLTDEETMFFCVHPNYHSKVLSKGFWEAYELH